MKKFKRQKFGKPIAGILMMTASGCLVVLLAGRYRPEPDAGRPPESTYISASGAENDGLIDRLGTGWNRFWDGVARSLAQTREEQEETYVPSVLQYNLMKVVPQDDGDLSELAKQVTVRNFKDSMEKMYRHFAGQLSLPYTVQPQDTAGGRLFEALSRRDAEWTSQLYRWIQATPEQAARRHKLPLTAVEGNYDPTNPDHDAADPSTWLIPSWKNVKIEIRDGDGKPIELYSNAQAIASLASVYTYYTGWEDAEQFEAYANRLWAASHSYSVSLGSVYYCEGCVDPEADALTASESAPKDVLLPEEGNLPIGASNGQETASGASEGGELPTVPSDTAALAGVAQNDNPAGDAGTAKTAGADASVAPQAAQEIAETSGAGTFAAPQAAQDSMSNIQAMTLALAAAARAGMQDGTDAGSPSIPESAPVMAPSEAGAPADNGAAGGAVIAGGAPASATSEKTAEIHLNEEGKFCPGHVDLTIKAKITGLTERKNLFNLAAPKTGGGWNGWDAYTKAYARSLYAQDWSEEYGLSLTELAIGKPLTSAEINRYMTMLPDDISNERRAVIAYALNSVGKIPYYYGGKAKAPGYENNIFCTLSLPDRKGRILTGLDCSGWVNWVYWSVTGEAPTVFGTSGLVRAGRAVSREELRPGDIIARLGANAHVMMFLGWTEDRSMICIHETGGTTGNVTVSVTNVRWPYYRALLE